MTFLLSFSNTMDIEKEISNKHEFFPVTSWKKIFVLSICFSLEINIIQKIQQESHVQFLPILKIEGTMMN